MTTEHQQVQDIIKERDSRHGGFDTFSDTVQELKDTIRENKGFERLESIHIVAIDNILEKITRAVNGDPDYIDNWKDIAGYAEVTLKYINK